VHTATAEEIYASRRARNPKMRQRMIMNMKKSPPLRVVDSPIHLLHRASQCADDHFARAVNGLGITARQYVVMSIVNAIKDPSQTTICEQSGIDRSTLADIVARLVSRGLLTRKRSRLDGRKYSVRLTEAGRACLSAAEPAAARVEASLLNALSAEERRSLGGTLERLIASSAITTDAEN
jgi:DNA-binding MarR family transcriptional regulator